MIGLWIPLVGALAYWLGSTAASEPRVTPEESPLVKSDDALSWSYQRRPMIGAYAPDPLRWHVQAALVSPLSYAYGELRERVPILDHRGDFASADRLASVALSAVPMMQARAAHGDHLAALWFNQGQGRFHFGVPPYPPPPPSMW